MDRFLIPMNASVRRMCARIAADPHPGGGQQVDGRDSKGDHRLRRDVEVLVEHVVRVLVGLQLPEPGQDRLGECRRRACSGPISVSKLRYSPSSSGSIAASAVRAAPCAHRCRGEEREVLVPMAVGRRVRRNIVDRSSGGAELHECRIAREQHFLDDRPISGVMCVDKSGPDIIESLAGVQPVVRADRCHVGHELRLLVQDQDRVRRTGSAPPLRREYRRRHRR